MNKNLFVALIPARGGSKGLKKKNLYPVNNKPLISWTIESAISSHYLEQIFVSSDDNSILEIASKPTFLIGLYGLKPQIMSVYSQFDFLYNKTLFLYVDSKCCTRSFEARKTPWDA